MLRNIGLTELILIGLFMVLFLITLRRFGMWASRKPCPECKELIMEGAKVCRYCGEKIEPKRT